MDPETFIATGYTKNYFAGTERLASAIGNGGLADVGHPIVDGLLPSRAHFLVQPHGKITDKSTMMLKMKIIV